MKNNQGKVVVPREMVETKEEAQHLKSLLEHQTHRTPA